VTGASGNIGRLLVERLISQDFEVVVLSSHANTSNHPNLEWHQISWGNLKVPVLNNIDIVVHLASQTSAYSARENVEDDILSNLIPVIRLVEKLYEQGNSFGFIFAGSFTEYGEIVQLPIEESQMVNPETFYDLLKVVIEQYLNQYVTEKKLTKFITLRLSNVYGFGDFRLGTERGFLNKLVESAIKKKSISFFGNRNDLRDFIHVEDVLRSFIASIERFHTLDGGFYNICSGVGTSFGDLFTKINLNLQARGLPGLQIEYVDSPPNMYPIEHRSHIGSYDKLFNNTGWTPTINIDQGLDLLIEKIVLKACAF